MESPNRYGERNVRPAKGQLELNIYAEDEYGMNRSEEPVEELDWSKDPRSEASVESHGDFSSEKKVTDNELKDKILSLLKLRSDFESEKISAEVSSGVVTLKGEVSTREQKVAVERAIETIEYIRDISNQVQIRSAG